MRVLARRLEGMAAASASALTEPSAATGAPGTNGPSVGIEQLLERLDHLEAIAEVFPGGIAMFDKDLNMAVCNSRLKAMLEYPDWLFADGNPTIEDLFRFNAERGEYGPGDVNELVRHRIDLVRRRVPHVYERTRPNGRTVEVRGTPLGGGGFLTLYLDVTEERRRTREMAVLIDNFPGGIVMFDKDLKMVLCNDRLKTMLDYPDSLFADGNPDIETVFRFNAERGEYGPGAVDELVKKRMALVNKHIAHDYERKRPDGTILEARGIPLADGGFVTTYQDVTEKRNAQARVAFLAHHDALTGLPNRLLLQDRLKQALASLRRYGGRLAVHYLDLDGFKSVNDTFGHAVGDGLLKSVGGQIRLLLRESDTAARIGGDEFVIVQNRVGERRDAEALAGRLIDALRQAFAVDGRSIRVGASVGICLAPDHGSDSVELIKRADAALYEAKEAGRGRFAVAPPSCP
jgi:diguanylate cyclase (GGDEF)-like protein